MALISGQPIRQVAYHGADREELLLDEDRGIFFSTEVEYARDYGPVVGRYELTILNPVVVSEHEANGTIEIDRHVLIDQGYDGRAIVYEDGSADIVAFFVGQATLVEFEPIASPRL